MGKDQSSAADAASAAGFDVRFNGHGSFLQV